MKIITREGENGRRIMVFGIESREETIEGLEAIVKWLREKA